MKYQKKILLFVFCLMMLSCTYSSQNKNLISSNSIKVDLSDTKKELLFTDFVESVREVSLKFLENDFLGRPTQACFTDQAIFIVDKQQKQIFQFDLNGWFVNKINKLGEGPGEYLAIDHFMIQKDFLYVCDKISRKINKYTLSGEFVKSISYREGVRDMTILPDGSFLCFTPDYIYDGPLGLWRMFENGEQAEVLMEYTEKYPIVYSDWSFFYATSSGAVGIACPATNRYLHYTERNLVVDMELKVKQKTANSFPGIDNNISVKEPYFACPIYIDSDNYLLGIWVEKGGQDRALYSLYSKKEHSMQCYDKITLNISGVDYMGAPIVSNLPNKLITYMVDEKENALLHIYAFK